MEGEEWSATSRLAYVMSMPYNAHVTYPCAPAHTHTQP